MGSSFLARNLTEGVVGGRNSLALTHKQIPSLEGGVSLFIGHLLVAAAGRGKFFLFSFFKIDAAKTIATDK